MGVPKVQAKVETPQVAIKKRRPRRMTRTRRTSKALEAAEQRGQAKMGKIMCRTEGLRKEVKIPAVKKLTLTTARKMQTTRKHRRSTKHESATILQAIGSQ